MSNSTKRALRTGLHVLIAVAAAVPAVVASLPSWEILGQVVAVAGVVSKVHNSLEEAGVVPTWLKGDDVPAPVAAVLAAAPDVATAAQKVVADVQKSDVVAAVADATPAVTEVKNAVEGDAAP